MSYFLDCDHDGHWYIIDADYRNEWSDWLDLDSDDPESWDTPHFVFEQINGHPSLVTFSDYELRHG